MKRQKQYSDPKSSPIEPMKLQMTPKSKEIQKSENKKKDNKKVVCLF